MEFIHSQTTLQCAQLSDAGVKPVNEDSMGIRIPEGSLLTHKGAVAVVADGVSAAEAGREASQACVQNLLYDYFCTPETWTVQKSVLTVLNALNRWLYSQGSHLLDESRGHVTTLSILIIKSSTAHIFHIGDSRIYRLRNDHLEQLTTDHTRVVGESTYLGRAMGLDSRIQVDYRKEELLPGDRFMLTTDGIHDFISTDQLGSLVTEGVALQDICAALHETALERGSNDNITCQLIDVESVSQASREELYQSLTALPFPPLLSAGNTLDGLTVERTLYESNRSQLYLVRDVNDELLVMKTPSDNFSDDPAYIERFAMESWVGRKMRHSKLVKIINRSFSPSCLYYLMEYVEGITLEDWIGKNNLPSLAQVVRIARQIGLGLRALHRQQVIHQDLKPGNVIIDDNEQVKLVDFGSCSMSSLKEINLLLKQEVALGTASYSAPECHLAKHVDERADVFSLAVIVFEMLTGKLPFYGRLESVESDKDLKRLKYQSATQLNNHAPHWFDLTLQKAMHFDPEQRYQDIDEFLHDLEHPNPALKASSQLPLLQRNPVRFWQFIASAQLLLIIYLLTLLV